MEKQGFDQNVECAIVKNQDLLKKNQETCGLLSKLVITTPLSEMALLGDNMF